MSARTLSNLGIVVSSIGIFFGFFFYFRPDVPLAIDVVTICSVGLLGLIGFIRHFFLHKSDAQRMGWETEHPDWQFEVGFANLAFGVVGICASFGKWGLAAQGAILAGYGTYLLQAALLNAYRSTIGGQKSLGRLMRSGLLTALISVLMIFFAYVALINSITR
jgi:hypothetical protein